MTIDQKRKQPQNQDTTKFLGKLSFESEVKVLLMVPMRDSKIANILINRIIYLTPSEDALLQFIDKHKEILKLKNAKGITIAQALRGHGTDKVREALDLLSL